MSNYSFKKLIATKCSPVFPSSMECAHMSLPECWPLLGLGTLKCTYLGLKTGQICFILISFSQTLDK